MSLVNSTIISQIDNFEELCNALKEDISFNTEQSFITIYY